MKVTSSLVAGAILALPLMTAAQFDTGGGTTSGASPWKELKLNPKTTIRLDFKNANPDMVISLLSKASGVTIVKDPSFKAPITVSSARAVKLEEAFQILSTVASLAGYDMRKEGSMVVIRKRPEAPGGGRGRGRGFDPAAMGGNAAAIFGQGGFPGMGGGNAPQGQLRVYEVKHANATQVARVINEVFANANQVNQNMNPFGGPMIMMGGGRQAGNQGGQGRQQQGPTVRASSDDFSNSVIVYAPSREQEQVEELIKRIDRQAEQPQASRVFKLVYAAAEDTAPIIQNVLINNQPRGRGGMGNQNIPFEQRFQAAMRFGGAQAAFGTVTADARTNSLVVSATEENLKLVEQVIQQLDQPVEVQQSTFVIPLENARADSLSDTLNQAFGNRSTGFGNFGNNRGNQNNRNRTNPSNRNRPRNNFNNPDNRTRSPQEAEPQEIELDLEDPNAEHGPLATQVFFGGFGQGQNRNRQAPARDAQGRITNVRDLAGQITIIPDPNTNSLIVVGSPEDAEMVRSIIEQLDRIPEQVMIETIIVEATLDASTKLGVEWQFSQDRAFGRDNAQGSGSTSFGVPNTPGSGFRYTLTGQNFQVFLNALKQDQKFNVLSTPRIFTSNNVEAEINISQQVPYVVSQREDANGNFVFNYEFQDVGIVLTVTPRISSNGIVTMDVVQTANDLQGFTDFNAPIVNQRQAQTTVSVKDGETIILGGIMRTTVNSTVRKVPLLGDIPLLGQLFRSTDRRNQKTELLVFLTPRIVRNPDDARKLREQNLSQMNKESKKAVEGAIRKSEGPQGGKP